MLKDEIRALKKQKKKPAFKPSKINEKTDDADKVDDSDDKGNKTNHRQNKSKTRHLSLHSTDEYNIYGRLKEWGYKHKTVNHSQQEYARDEDGDGFYEVNVTTIEEYLRSYFLFILAFLNLHTIRESAEKPY